jgi:hypothetical protein
MKIYGNQADSSSPLRILGDEFRRFHPAAELIVGTCWVGTEKLDHNVIEGHEAGTNDGLRDKASVGFERYSQIRIVYYDDQGLKEAGITPPAKEVTQPARTCKTHGCPAGFHVCTKY